MISVVEDLLTEVIVERLEYLRNNLDRIDRIFSCVSKVNRENLKTYIRNNSIKVIRGFPRDQSTIPVYAILLGAERQVNDYIGGYMDESEQYRTIKSVTETLTVKRKFGSYVVVTTKKPVQSIESVECNGEQYASEVEILDEKLGIILLEFPVDLGDEITITYNYLSEGDDLYGVMINSQYRIETWTNNGDLTVMLYHLLKWIMLSAKDKLTERGLIIQDMGGTDFEPQPEYFPEFVYRRAMLFNAQYEISIGKETGYITDIKLEGGEEG